MTNCIALIPARAGSKRIPQKNIRELAGHPLIAYTISAAINSGCFEKVLVSSDSKEILSIAQRYGADCLRRPDEYATDTSPDIEWVRHALEATNSLDVAAVEWMNHFSILRPTSPFRKPETIQRAMFFWDINQIDEGEPATSLRAMERAAQHPGKMWVDVGHLAVPLLMQPRSQPFHDSQYASLPPVYVQNASLEIARVSTVTETGTISGPRVLPFFTSAEEGFDLNTEEDWAIAQMRLERGEFTLPEIHHV